mgnify:CR=1 FL=1
MAVAGGVGGGMRMPTKGRIPRKGSGSALRRRVYGHSGTVAPVWFLPRGTTVECHSGCQSIGHALLLARLHGSRTSWFGLVLAGTSNPSPPWPASSEVPVPEWLLPPARLLPHHTAKPSVNATLLQFFPTLRHSPQP